VVYVIAQAVVIRRLADTTKGVISLAKLIQEMQTTAKAKQFTREIYRSQWDLSNELMSIRADEGWSLFSGGGEHFDPTLAQADLKTLTDDAEKLKLKTFVDERVAHRAEHPSAPDVPTFEDLNQAIDDLGTMFRKSSQILKAAHWMTLEAHDQEDWEAVFRVPWIPTTT
jgi:hypothetical protein